MKTVQQQRNQESNERLVIAEQQTDIKVAIAVIQSTLATIKEDVLEIKKKLELDYVSRQEFDPIKKGYYAVIGLILTAIVGAVLTLVLKQ